MAIHPPLALVCLTGADVALVREVVNEATARAGLDPGEATTAPIGPSAPVTLSYLAARWNSVAAPDLKFVAVLDLSVGGDMLFAIPTRGEERHLLAALAVDWASRLLRDHPEPETFDPEPETFDEETLDDLEAWRMIRMLLVLADRFAGAS